MKAKIKATGEIVHVGDYNTIHHDPMYKNERTGPWRLEELDFTETPDYWIRLEHQYAGMAMQGMMNNSYLAGEFRKDPNNGIEDMSKIITKAAAVYAHALVEKMKEERK